MQLWNDYEGKTIADTYSLGPLLRPEGRSALFALPEGAEAPAVIRLTESLNDENQILAGWKRVAELQQENLVAIKRFGETTFEGTPLTYAVMERADANLADLLKERPLTSAEAMQVAASAVAALAALHARGLIHEHVDAAHVVAVGETVKLRTDCVRECVLHPDDASPENCQKLIQRDVHDLATLLLRALTLESKLTPGMQLRAPFDQIIRNGITGAWGLAEIAAALHPPAAPAPRAASRSVVPASVPPPEPAAAAAARAADPLHFQRRIHTPAIQTHSHRKVWVGLAVAALVIVAFLLHGISSSPRVPARAAESAAVTQTPPQSSQPAAAAPSSPTVAPARPSSVVAPPQPSPAAHLQAGWYVVAYTFNREADALKRAAALAQRHPGLRPQVIAPGGRSPYLIALGGPMARPEAESVQRRARQSGLPRDTFVRNYKGY